MKKLIILLSIVLLFCSCSVVSLKFKPTPEKSILDYPVVECIPLSLFSMEGTEIDGWAVVYDDPNTVFTTDYIVIWGIEFREMVYIFYKKDYKWYSRDSEGKVMVINSLFIDGRDVFEEY